MGSQLVLNGFDRPAARDDATELGRVRSVPLAPARGTRTEEFALGITRAD